jgi:uncharacterized membrane protein
MTISSVSPKQRNRAILVNRWAYWISRYWLLVFSLSYGLFVGLPFIAPILMELGWEWGGRAIYLVYTFFCHQLPQRSLFLFGPKGMYSLVDIQAAWQDTINPLVLRQFVGNPDMGWKVAWSDRMVSMYSSILIFAWAWYPLRRKVPKLPLLGLALLLVPMGVDGITHSLSDFAGLGLGFRDSNLWLVGLTHNAFSTGFYSGDALGSFNSWMRWFSGFAFGLGVVWFGFPYLHEFFSEIVTTIESKFHKDELEL